MATGIATEFEELGVVTLIGVLVVPGLMWVVSAKTGGSAFRRFLLVGGIVAGALALEATIDRSANSVVDAVTGN